MKNSLDIKIKGTDRLPSIYYNSSTNTLSIIGRSVAEYVDDYYLNIFNWIDLYKDHGPSHKLTIIVKLEYANTPSIKMLATFFKHIDNIDCDIEWYYEEDDESMLMLGEDLQEVTKRKFRLIEFY